MVFPFVGYKAAQRGLDAVRPRQRATRPSPCRRSKKQRPLRAAKRRLSYLRDGPPKSRAGVEPACFRGPVRRRRKERSRQAATRATPGSGKKQPASAGLFGARGGRRTRCGRRQRAGLSGSTGRNATQKEGRASGPLVVLRSFRPPPVAAGGTG